MGKSSFDYTTAASASGTNSSPWTASLSVGKNIFDFYDSKGDVTISGATEIDSDVSGPIVVARYGILTVNAKLTVKNPCRGLVILCDTLSMGAAGDISMTGKGCGGSPLWPAYDLSVPDSVAVSAQYVRLKQYLAIIRSKGWFIGDPVLAALGSPELGDALAALSNGTVLLSADGCAAGGGESVLSVAADPSNQVVSQQGFGGTAGSAAPGGGGGGGETFTTGNYVGHATGGKGGNSRPWSGGDSGLGSSTAYAIGTPASGFGSGNSSPGGIVLVICRGTATLTSGHKISSKSLDVTTPCAGSAGGGFAALAANSVSGSPAFDVSAGTPGSNGGQGGPGASVSKTWAEMGWS